PPRPCRLATRYNRPSTFVQGRDSAQDAHRFLTCRVRRPRRAMPANLVPPLPATAFRAVLHEIGDRWPTLTASAKAGHAAGATIPKDLARIERPNVAQPDPLSLARHSAPNVACRNGCYGAPSNRLATSVRQIITNRRNPRQS